MYFLLFLMQLIASITHVVAKDATNTLPGEVVLFFRGIFAASAFGIWLAFRKKKFPQISTRDWITIIILAIINIPINQYLFFKAIHLTTAPNVSLIYALTPVFVFIIAVIFFKEKVSIKKALGILIAFGGVLLMLFERNITLHSDHFIGNILVLIACIAWSVYTVIGKQISTKYGAGETTALTMIIGLLIYLPFFAIQPAQIPWQAITTKHWIQFAYLGLLNSALAYVIWYYVLTKIEASKVAVFNNMQPLLTTFLAVIFMGHILTQEYVIGAALVISGVILTQKG